MTVPTPSPSTPSERPSAVVRSAEGRAAGTHVPGASRAMQEMAAGALHHHSPSEGSGRPAHAWLGGRCLAMLDDLPDHTEVMSEYATEGAFEAWGARAGLEDLHDGERPDYVILEVVRWDDDTVPTPPAPLTRPDTAALRKRCTGSPADDDGQASCSQGELLDLLDWIDAQPAPLTPTPQPDGGAL